MRKLITLESGKQRLETAGEYRRRIRLTCYLCGSAVSSESHEVDGKGLCSLCIVSEFGGVKPVERVIRKRFKNENQIDIMDVIK